MKETSFTTVAHGGCGMIGSGCCPKPLEKMRFLNKKWALGIIVTIGNFGSLRFNDLLKRTGGITQKTLAETLRELEEHNVVARAAFPENPRHVEYSLTKSGKKVRDSVLPLIRLAGSGVLGK